VRVRNDYMNLKYHYSILILAGGGVRAFLENPVEFFDLGPGARFSKVPVTLRARNQIFKSKYKE